MDVEELKTKFEAVFGQPASATYFAPGRINLIGEHTDYNGGHVFPCAISLGTYAAVAQNDAGALRLYSGNFDQVGIVEVALSDLATPADKKWTDYFKGMAQLLQKNYPAFTQGLDVYIFGNLPNGAGLSSSASLELLAGTILKDQYGLKESMLDLIKLGQKVENGYIGVNSGIMDQFAIGMGKANHATLLDTNTLEYESVPLDLQDNVILIMNTNKRRELADSKYNERRSECEEALRRLQTKLDIKTLGDLNEDQFDQASYLIYDGTLIRRARHAVFENQRTIKAAAQLKAGDLVGFGHLVSASGVSLAYDYEVTGVELDTLVKEAVKQPGVLGARMTGAGFGGCAIALVAKDHVDAVKAAVGAKYQETIGYAPSFYVAEIADGPKRLD
ncbi:galactokinase [Lacticaseibacillus camelliae]|uniref:Galactokinase n=1 Tax=Lacticaseibacillus camelliae DSM 22697 = JCM 13995 TaxID=1423730 RepID=A0A0R2F491_9LACO|nr:galactokinase [Lacticaseibacillus camelliae]KRN23369.1 galactokinase [Lacticaseibacillus camelliae DSM 22697 = JCM 13995]